MMYVFALKVTHTDGSFGFLRNDEELSITLAEEESRFDELADVGKAVAYVHKYSEALARFEIIPRWVEEESDDLTVEEIEAMGEPDPEKLAAWQPFPPDPAELQAARKALAAWLPTAFVDIDQFEAAWPVELRKAKARLVELFSKQRPSRFADLRDQFEED